MKTSMTKAVISSKMFVHSNNKMSALGSLDLQAAGHPFLINSPQQLREVINLQHKGP